MTTALLATPALTAWASAVDDDFTTALLAPQWSRLEDAPAQLTLAQQNGRVEVLANNPSSNLIDALYLSNGPQGFRLGTTQDFEITLDYALTPGSVDASNAVLGDLLGLVFGVGRDLDGTDSAAIGYGIGRQQLGPFITNGTALAAGVRIDDAQTENVLSVFSPNAGTFRIAYDAAGDDLTLGVTQAGISALVLQDTVRGLWNAESLFVSLGARGGGFSFSSGDAWLDGFRVLSGDVQPIVAALAGDYTGNGSVEQGDLDLVLNNWGQPRGDWANAAGFASAGVDQEELDRVLNHWGGSAAASSAGHAVPEPGVFALLAVGLCGWCGLGRGRTPRRSA